MIGMLLKQPAFRQHLPSDSGKLHSDKTSEPFMFHTILANEKNGVQEAVTQIKTKKPLSHTAVSDLFRDYPVVIKPNEQTDATIDKTLSNEITSKQDIGETAAQILELLKISLPIDTEKTAAWSELATFLKVNESLPIDDQIEERLVKNFSDWLKISFPSVFQEKSPSANQLDKTGWKEEILTPITSDENMEKEASAILERLINKFSDLLEKTMSIANEPSEANGKTEFLSGMGSGQDDTTSKNAEFPNEQTGELNQAAAMFNTETEGSAANRLWDEISASHKLGEKLSLTTDNQLQQSHELRQSIPKQMTELYAKVEALIAEITTRGDISRTAPTILELLKQWTSLEKQLQGSQATASLESEGTKLDSIWKGLVLAFQKREQFPINGPYKMEAAVTTKDISRWLGRSLEIGPSTERTIQNQGAIYHTMPVSKLEQYVIYMNQTQNATTDNQSFMDQFRKVIKSSKFLAQPNGTSQLSVKLNPGNLGEMMLRLTEINGEMTVKIVVTSAKAKEMLESNIHQLRHMFSPNQVLIEKQDAPIPSGLSAQREDNDQPKEQEDQSSDQHTKEKNKEQSEDNFDSYFQKLLLNEEV